MPSPPNRVRANITPSSEVFSIVQLGHYNRKTGDWLPGFGYPKIGNRSIDRSWVYFEVVAVSQVEAEERVRKYCAMPSAKFTGMSVCLTPDYAILGDQTKIKLVEGST